MTEPRFTGYSVVSELGSGALSTVYKATQEPLGRKAVLLRDAVLASRQLPNAEPARRPKRSVDDGAGGLPGAFPVDEEEHLDVSAKRASQLRCRRLRVGPVPRVAVDQRDDPVRTFSHRRGW